MEINFQQICRPRLIDQSTQALVVPNGNAKGMELAFESTIYALTAN